MNDLLWLSQGPRGLPGERGRPGAAGAAVSGHLAQMFLCNFLNAHLKPFCFLLRVLEEMMAYLVLLARPCVSDIRNLSLIHPADSSFYCCITFCDNV